MGNQQKKNLSRFEALNETSRGSLVGGFSIALTATIEAPADTNNCQGGNCKIGCGAGQNVGACNSIPGCGVKL